MSLPDPIFQESDLLVREHSDTMHRWLMNIAMVYSVLFSLFSLYLNDYPQALATIVALPISLLCYYFFKSGRVVLSKFLNLIQIILVVTALCLLTGNGSFAFMYYFPVIISCMFIFQGKQKKMGYGLASLAVILLFIVTALDLRLSEINLNENHQQEDQLSNIVGVCTSCILLFVFSIKSSDIILNRLLIKARELQIKNEQLAAAVYTREKMISVISHDLRSPIIALNSAMSVFSEQDIDPVTQKDIVGQIKSKSNRLLVMIDELLNWIKSHANTIEVKIDSIEIQKLIEYSKEQMHIIGEPKSIKFEVINSSSHKFLMGDINMIKTVIRNLLSNAVKYSMQNGIIQLELVEKNNQVQVSIVDFGTGMSPSEIKNIEQGVTFSTKGSSNEIGYGLGLQLVKEFLNKNNSQLEVVSGLGLGSKFSFALPTS